MEFIYQKELNLDEENNFTIEISEMNNVEKVEMQKIYWWKRISYLKPGPET